MTSIRTFVPAGSDFDRAQQRSLVRERDREPGLDTTTLGRSHTP
ncbi:hypothetical protein [Nocardia miyunensis]|nr:hypothetical protein [Nocardia miyunensis]